MTKSDQIFVNKLKRELKLRRKVNQNFPKMEQSLLNIIKTYEQS